MPKIQYQAMTISPSRLNVIKQANAIIEEYRGAGYDLTLRQLYYQFVARDLIANRQQEYKKLGDIIADGRMAGLVDWNAIVDRTRYLRSVSTWDAPSDIIGSAAYGYRTDKWANQTYQPEVWIEKDALVGVIERVCNELEVPFFSCRGYTSLSEMWSAGQRLKRHIKAGQTPIVLHFGDHDPSGMDMTRDIRDRLDTFMGGTEVRRLALNFDQIEAFNPPPNPAKMTDSRATAYVAEFGTESWELDALDPTTLSNLVKDTILSLRDDDQWTTDHDAQERERRVLNRIKDNYDEVSEFVAQFD